MMLRMVAIVAVLALAGCGGKVFDGGFLPKWGKNRGERVVLINTFTVPAGKTGEAVEMWQAARDFMKEQDGYISTRLHISVDENARYRLINIAKWESAKHFRAAAKALRQSGVVRPIDGIIGNPQLYKPVRRKK